MLIKAEDRKRQRRQTTRIASRRISNCGPVFHPSFQPQTVPIHIHIARIEEGDCTGISHRNREGMFNVVAMQ